jgi:hypothetical protein
MHLKIIEHRDYLLIAISKQNYFIFSAGYENHPFQFISGSIPSVFTFPGTSTVSYHAKRGIDLPTDLVMAFKLKKVAPYVYDVPCTLGQGSW